MSLKTKRLPSNAVRLPDPSRGEATLVLRYKTEHSVILHPDDFDTLRLVSDFVEEACELEPLEVTDLSERVHLEEDRPSGRPIHDRAALLELFAE